MMDGAARFWGKVDKRGPDECWPWLGHKRNGYGVIRFRSQNVGTHRVSLILDGRLPPSTKHQACHRCDNPPCCNPAHLWWGTNSENRLDAAAKLRLPGMTRTHCKRGHELVEDNLLTTGYRRCRTCQQESVRRYEVRAQRGTRPKCKAAA